MRTYVDNAYNRRVGRVGMPVGSMVISKASGASYCAEYVDNKRNRALGRVGMPKGSLPVSQNNGGNCISIFEPHTYQYFGGIEMPLGNMVIAKQEPRERPSITENDSTAHSGYSSTRESVPFLKSSRESTDSSIYEPTSYSSKTNVDNEFNRSVGRVEMPSGTMMLSKDDAWQRHLRSQHEADSVFRLDSASPKAIVDEAFNCSVENVMSQNNEFSKETGANGGIIQRHEHGALETVYDFMDDYRLLDCEPMPGYQPFHDKHMAKLERIQECMRHEEEMQWNPEYGTDAKSMEVEHTSPLNELQLRDKIGEGRFAVVYFYGTAVSVKKINKEKTTKNLVESFKDEINFFRTFDHPNIVRYIGAYEDEDQLCIAMEYMEETLFDFIHINKCITNIDDDQRLTIIRQICLGMLYLHVKSVAHGDLKPHNILMTVSGRRPMVKISDISLSLVGKGSETILSGNAVLWHETPQYAAPEILRQEHLTTIGMMRADIWSLALIVFEIIYEKTPYHNFSLLQVQKQVGETGCAPEVPKEVMVNPDVRAVIEESWTFDPEDRPDVKQISDVLLDATYIFRQ